MLLTLSELATLIAGDIVRGDPAAVYSGMAALDAAEPGDVGFLGNDKYRNQFLVSSAGAVVVPRGETDGRPETALVAVDNPTLAFAAVVKYFADAALPFVPGIHPRAFVDPSVEIDPEKVSVGPGAVILAGVKIGEGTVIGPNCVISTQVVIGRDCRIYPNVTIRERCILGDRVILQPGVVIGADGYGYQFSEGRHVKIDQVGIVVLGDDVEIGANSTVDRARFGKTFIGSGTKIDNLVQIGHNVTIGEHCLIVSLTGISGSAKLGHHVTVGGQVGTAGHITIGDHASLAGRTGVTQDLPGGQAYKGQPAIPIRDSLKLDVLIRRLPKLAEQVRELWKRAGLDKPGE